MVLLLLTLLAHAGETDAAPPSNASILAKASMLNQYARTSVQECLTGVYASAVTIPGAEKAAGDPLKDIARADACSSGAIAMKKAGEAEASVALYRKACEIKSGQCSFMRSGLRAFERKGLLSADRVAAETAWSYAVQKGSAPPAPASDRVVVSAGKSPPAGSSRPAIVDDLADGGGTSRSMTDTPAPAPATAVPAPAAMPPAPSAPAPLPSIDARLATGRQAPREAAVAIGFEDYLMLPDVAYAKRDAQAFADFLRFTRGVPADRIQILTSGSREHVEKAIAAAADQAGAGGTVWVYFAGHGAASPTTRERVLLGDDVRADATSFETRGLPVAQVEQLATARGGQAVMVLDTCYAGFGRDGGELLAGTRFAVPAYAATVAKGASQWNAASPNELSGPLDAARHGAFTYFAIGALRGWADGELDGTRDGRVTAAEAQSYVTRALRLAQKRDQVPSWVGDDTLVLAEGVTEQGPDL